jgi:ribosomal protein L37AE/L43A
MPFESCPICRLSLNKVFSDTVIYQCNNCGYQKKGGSEDQLLFISAETSDTSKYLKYLEFVEHDPAAQMTSKMCFNKCRKSTDHYIAYGDKMMFKCSKCKHISV